MRNFLEFIPQTDDIDLSRIDRFQKKMSNRVASICSERAVLYTESFKQTEGEPYILRKAKAFAHTLAHMTVYIESDSLIFGNQASSNFAAPVFPEFSIDWVVDELDGTNGATAFDKRSGDVFQCSEQVKLLTGMAIHIRMKSLPTLPMRFVMLLLREFYILAVSQVPEMDISFQSMSLSLDVVSVLSLMKQEKRWLILL